MRVKNRKCIRRLSFKSLWASRKRNIIAICAIALTTLMFTSLFTIMLSVNSSYETYNFRQAGGYSDGSFKDLSREQADKIAAHKGIKASGERIVCGFSSSDVFGKVAAEVSYMDKNCTKWSYATPTTGKEPQKENEIAMDTTALRLLGVEPKLGTNVTITYQAGNGTDTGIPQTDSFILVGYWEYDDLMPVHYINVSKAYVDKINEKCIAAGDEALDIDLNVMLPSKLNIREQMEKIDTDLGYDWNTRDQENSARIGVNWGLTASSVSSDIDFSLVAAILAFFLLIIFTGYLIISFNIVGEEEKILTGVFGNKISEHIIVFSDSYYQKVCNRVEGPNLIVMVQIPKNYEKVIEEICAYTNGSGIVYEKKNLLLQISKTKIINVSAAIINIFVLLICSFFVLSIKMECDFPEQKGKYIFYSQGGMTHRNIRKSIMKESFWTGGIPIIFGVVISTIFMGTEVYLKKLSLEWIKQYAVKLMGTITGIIFLFLFISICFGIRNIIRIEREE